MSDNSRVRVSIVGVIVVALFTALLARLWFLQVGSGETFQIQVNQRSLRVVQTESSRGQILDALGRPLVSNRLVWALTVRRDITDAQRTMLFGRLAELLGGNYTAGLLERRYTDPRQSPLEPALLVLDTPESARITILEHREDYPGVEVQQLTVRSYPNGSIAAQTLGYVGEVNADELKKLHGYVSGDTIGQSGVERYYESYLRGRPQISRYEVTPAGVPVGDPVVTRPGTIGDSVELSINLDVQRVAENTLAQALVEARTRTYKNAVGGLSQYTAPGGAIVALDANTGSIVAMASNPTFGLEKFVGGVTNSDWQALTSKASNLPLTNRATQGLYAPGSTFKLVTSVAATRDGVRGPNVWITDNGSIQIGGDKRSFHNAHNEALGPLSLQQAITKSSDVYFYGIGYAFWQAWQAHQADGLGIQQVAREFGFGDKTGVELDEASGSRVPTPDWKASFAKILYPHDKQAQLENSQWYPGDNVNLAVGQGDMVATPLQLADAYAAFANGGTLYEPHVAAAIKSADGKSVKQVAPKVIRHIAFDPTTYQAMLAGFHGAVSDPKGTAYPAFQGFPLNLVSVAGKTGTAQVNGKGDTSLFVGFFDANGHKYVVAAVIEDAGFGSEVAAPAVRRVIEQISGIKPLTPLDIKPQSGVD